MRRSGGCAYDPRRRRIVLFREVVIAYGVLLVFLLLGGSLLRFLRLQPEAVSIAGGIVLFLIALRMIFPSQGTLSGEPLQEEPFVVPLAIPLVAGPSTLATLLLLQSAPSMTTWASAVRVSESGCDRGSARP